VRLLNVDTPESVDPDKPVECLGPEASQYLRDRLPAGTQVRLERDEDEVDRYGRELAAVFLGKELINASIAENGLGVAMSVGGNTKYLEPVQTAQERARAAGRGLYSTTTACTVPAQVAQLQATITEMSQAPASTAGLEEIDSFAAELLAARTAARTVVRLLDGATDVFPLAAHTAAEIADMTSKAQSAVSRISRAETTNDQARAAELKRLEAKKAAEEAARKAAEEAARQAAERAAAEAAAAEAARVAAAQAATRQSSSGGSAPRSSSPRSSSSGSSSSGGSGYTGCRSYAPGGKTWTPIPC
jgi:micrococcal nuclease